MEHEQRRRLTGEWPGGSSSTRGVRAEPTFPRDRTRLESLTTAWSGFSSYVSQNLPASLSRNQSLQLNSGVSPPFMFYKPSEAYASPAGPAKSASTVEEAKSFAITDATFQWVETAKRSCHQGQGKRRSINSHVDEEGHGMTRRLVLQLAYSHGFQLWDVTNPDDIRELCNVSSHALSMTEDVCKTMGYTSGATIDVGEVSHLLGITTSTIMEHGYGNPAEDFRRFRPLLAIVATSEPKSPSTTNPTTDSKEAKERRSEVVRTRIYIYSLHTHTIVHVIHPLADLQTWRSSRAELEEDVNDVQHDSDNEHVEGCEIKCSDRLLVVALRTNQTRQPYLLPYSSHTFQPIRHEQQMIVLSDLPPIPNDAPVPFDVGQRFIAYATRFTPAGGRPGGQRGERSASGGGGGGRGKSGMKRQSGYNNGTAGGFVDRDVRDTARDALKEVAAGITKVGQYGYRTMEAYLASSGHVSPGGHVVMPGEERSGKNEHSGVQGADGSSKTERGMVIVRDLMADKIPARGPPIVAHIWPHTHDISHVSFNPAGTLLVTVSRQGHTFHIFSLHPSTPTGLPANAGGQAKILQARGAGHLYHLSRGMTDAQIESAAFSQDSLWCGVTTARGTTHLYALNPYGGETDVAGHVANRVKNSANLRNGGKTSLVTLTAPLRIKQRNPMPLPENQVNASMASRDPSSVIYAHIPTANMDAIHSTSAGDSTASQAPIPLQTQFFYVTGQDGIPYVIPGQPVPANAEFYRQIMSSNNASNRPKLHRARLTTTFLMPGQNPYLLNPNGAARRALSLSGHLRQPSGSPEPGRLTGTFNGLLEGSGMKARSKSLADNASYMLNNVGNAVASLGAKRRSVGSIGGFGQLFSGITTSSSDHTHEASPPPKYGQDSSTSWARSRDDSDDADRLFGFDEEQLDTLYGDELSQHQNTLQSEAFTGGRAVSTSDGRRIGYRDMYSFHPVGILTLHRYWIVMSTIRRREDGRVKDGFDMSLASEDIAEWMLARGSTWKEVKIPLDPPVNVLPTQEDATVEQEESPKAIPVTATSIKKKKKKERVALVDSSENDDSTDPSTDPVASSPLKQPIRSNTPSEAHYWLSNYETTTYYAQSQTPLWCTRQFQFATFADPDVEQRLQRGEKPSTKPIVIRRETPEPYGRRMEALGADAAKESMAEGDVNEKAATLEENLSTAMQTQLESASGFSPSSALYSGMKRMSYGGIPANTRPSVERGVSLSFEDAQLIKVGSSSNPTSLSPSPHVPSHLHGWSPSSGTQAYPGQGTILNASSRTSSTTNLATSGWTRKISKAPEGEELLIRFDDLEINPPELPFDEDVDYSGGKIVTHPDEDDHSDFASDAQEQVYAPDGDNEVDVPDQSIHL
ncbi:hypothetical protein BZG36_04214 [Bifiguratus adelaidae]|uniref:BCAS3 WD40 domain-containing protein n=1 Tax=Bifiguratus adelaidae TaxID=1938954 RepID=A0A261XYD6_9FUNG|nr:hypothetical protein BZG36_04214 [Bifiguratus adelaidae]